MFNKQADRETYQQQDKRSCGNDSKSMIIWPKNVAMTEPQTPTCVTQFQCKMSMSRLTFANKNTAITHRQPRLLYRSISDTLYMKKGRCRISLSFSSGCPAWWPRREFDCKLPHVGQTLTVVGSLVMSYGSSIMIFCEGPIRYILSCTHN
jgi:hypothetical protein